MSDKIKAAIRVRPFLERQLKNGYTNNRIVVDQNKKQISVNEDNSSKRVFHFDHLFSENNTQDDIYSQCRVDHLLQKALEGYHSTIFAYGQTGSGKTYTMQGAQQITEEGKKKQLDGLIPKIIQNLFSKIGKATNRTYSISVSFLQIYNERIYDLLNPTSLNPKNIQQLNSMGGLRLRWNKNQQFSVENLFVYECKNSEELTKYFVYGLKNRINSAHKLNMQSSRSHSILTIRVQSFSHINPQSILSSKIELVDLAGSERIGLTGTQGKLAKQSIDINKSLFTLRQVISILADMSRNRNSSQGRRGEDKEKNYIPYRDSKLTSILKQSIGGNSYSLMIACINPNDSFIDENLSTLTYATKASYITNQPTINDDPRSKMINQLRHQVKQLNNQLIKANQHIQIISSMQGGYRQKNLIQSQQSSSPQKPSTQSSQKLMNDSEEQPAGLSQRQPLLKKKLNEKLNQNYDQFSERLVQSINMVRQLLKSNKQLREQIQTNTKKMDQKDIQIYELTRQNQILRERVSGDEPLAIGGYEQGRKSSQMRNRSSVHSNNIPYNNQPKQVSNTNNQGITASTKNNFNYWNSVQINQYYMNQRGIDSMPTNFNRREISSAQDKRIMQSRGNGTPGDRAATSDRHAITAKVTKRSWMSKNSEPKKFLSFYNDPAIRDQVGFY